MVGKRIFGLVVRDESGIRITWAQAVIRNITKFQPEILLVETIASKLRKTDYQQLLDIVAKTIIVKKIIKSK